MAAAGWRCCISGAPPVPAPDRTPMHQVRWAALPLMLLSQCHTAASVKNQLPAPHIEPALRPSFGVQSVRGAGGGCAGSVDYGLCSKAGFLLLRISNTSRPCHHLRAPPRPSPTRSCMLSTAVAPLMWRPRGAALQDSQAFAGAIGWSSQVASRCHPTSRLGKAPAYHRLAASIPTWARSGRQQLRQQQIRSRQ